MKKVKETNYSYAAGISNLNGKWTWQGSVIAPTLREAKGLLTQFKRENGMSGVCHVERMFDKVPTSFPKGIYSM